MSYTENEQTEIIHPSHDVLEEARLEAEQIILTAKKEQESIKADLMQEKLELGTRKSEFNKRSTRRRI